MARANSTTVPVMAQQKGGAAAAGTTGGASTAPKTKTAGRHAGPWGASFDGTEPDGKTKAKGLTFERRWTRPGIHPYPSGGRHRLLAYHQGRHP